MTDGSARAQLGDPVEEGGVSLSPSTGGETSEEHVDILDQESYKGREGTTRTYSP